MLKNFVYITVVIAAFALLWIGFSIKYNLDVSTITPETNENIQPITPSFDITTLNQLKTRTSVPIDLSQPAPGSSSTSISSESAIQQFTKPSISTQLPETTPVASDNARQQ